jgi:hypothetical protein
MWRTQVVTYLFIYLFIYLESTSNPEDGSNVDAFLSHHMASHLSGKLKPNNCTYICFQGGHAIAELVEALCHKPEGRRFESRTRWIFFQFT